MSAAQRTEMNQRMDQMNQLITVLQGAMTDATQEIVNLRTTVSDTSNMAINLKNTSDAAWTSQTAKISQIENDLQDAKRNIDTTFQDLKTQIGANQHSPNRNFWSLEHKGTLKEFAGDKKLYKSWAKKVKAFCNSKQPGFRSALTWAE